MRRQPLFILFISFILGIIFQNYFVLSVITIIIFIVIGVVIVAFGFLRTISKLQYFGIIVMFFGFGVLSVFLNNPIEPAIQFSKNDEVLFKIEKKLNSNVKNRKYEALVYHQNQWVKSIVIVPKDFEELDFKHYYKGNGFINKLTPPQYDYQFDYHKYMARKSIFYQMYFGEPLQSSVRNDLTIVEEIRQFRLQLLQKINGVEEIKEKNRELLKGIILADRTDMDSEVVLDFNKTGLVHILAISGSHMVLIFWIVFTILSRIIHHKKAVIIIAILFIWMFTIFIDYGNSVVRSSIMISMYYIYVLLDRKPDLIHSLSMAGLLILVFDPFQFFDVGFQLSFLAVLGIYWFNTPIQNLFPIVSSKIWKYCLSIISITLSAQLATLPLVIYYFNQFPVISLFSNIIAIPIAEGVIIVSLFMAVLFSVGIDFLILNFIYDFLSSIFLEVVHFFAKFDVLLLQKIPLNLVEVSLLFVLIFSLKFLLVKRTVKNRNIVVGVALLLFLVKITFDLNAYNHSEKLVHQMFNNQIVSYKEKDNIIFWIPENVDYKRVEKFIIFPYLMHSRTRNFDYILINNEVEEIIIDQDKISLE